VLQAVARLRGVLSLWKLSAGEGPERYYLEQVAHGQEDYYAGEGEAPGQWAGSGASALGLGGRVEDHELERLLQARDPSTGEELRRPMRDGAVTGFDLTFRAPKSVGILWGAGEGEVAREVREAHDCAVERALGYLEREACLARRGHGGREHVRGDGFVAAAFRHRASRASDPLLHTHVVVGNLTRGPDGRWTALDGRLLYRHAKTAGVLYQAELRGELVRRLGVEFGPVEHGCADLTGVPREVIEHFSQRRAEIVEHMDAHGGRSAKRLRSRRLRRAARSSACRTTGYATSGAHEPPSRASDATSSRHSPAARGTLGPWFAPGRSRRSCMS
jgi:conjugative relaxase-like TrwC/TraI family protein